MSKETSGVGQGALPPKDDQSLRAPVGERPAGSTLKMCQVVGGQYVFNPQSPGMTLKQVMPGSAAGNTSLSQRSVTRIISISPSRSGQTSPLRPSLANQSIVNILTKPRTNSNIRLQLFTSPNDGNSSSAQVSSSSRPVKRPLSATSTEKKDAYAAKLQRVINHRIVRSKLVKEKYNEHLLETFYLENESNILDLYQFAKRPKTQAYLAYLNEHAIDPNDFQDETPTVVVPQTTPSTPSATPLNSLPGISSSHNAQTNSTPPVSDSNHVVTPKSTPKVKTATQATTNQEMIVEKAKQEAYVVQRIADLQKEGLWSEKRLPKVQEMSRTKAHWDFLLEEMVWLAADFAQERKWKKAAAKKCARMVQKYFQDKALTVQKAEKAQEQNIRRIAAFCAKEIKNFWNSVEKLVEYKQNMILEEKRKKALDQQLSFIVDQTEKYSQLLAEGMNKTADQTQSVSRPVSDDEFDPDMQSEEDDEETIDQEEAAVGNDDGHAEEVEALQKESQMELDDLLNDNFLRDYLLNRDTIRLSGSEDSDDEDEETTEHDKKSKSSEESESIKEDEEKEQSSDEEDDTVKGDEKTGEDEGLKMLLDDTIKEGGSESMDKKDDYLNDAAAIAESIQPKGNTLSSTNVSTNIPFLVKYTLREYQHIGLDWLVTMFDRKLNGILADEMGLGKTIQTIALLAHLACEKGNWGPHLIIVPTSVMLNWEMECKKWCPAFKILTYYGTQKERKFKRIGWTKPNAFHICITSYKLVVQDHQSFRRKKWKYLILDEAQNIKNFKSQRWQLLLNFQTQQRLLLTGTPLQNNLMELWSLMHFLMPNVFQSHREFKEWFSNPVTGMIEGNSEYNENIIKRLHKVLRPFLLRRLKSEVEKQMPKKYEHVVMCRLSKRQRFLYDDYMSKAKTKETLASGNLLSVINVLMQLRKVCNHPNLFEVRPTTSPFQCVGIRLHIPSIVYSALEYDPFKHVDLYAMNLLLIMQEIHLSSYQCYRIGQSKSVKMTNYLEVPEAVPICPPSKLAMRLITDKNAVPIKPEKGEPSSANRVQPQTQLKTFPAQNVKIKVSGMRIFNQQALFKTFPLVNISQGSTGQITSENVAAATNFAQLVQTSTGKHLLLTSNPSATGNIPVTDNQAGQKLTFLSNQPVSTLGNTSQQVTKAFVKFQLGSVASTSSANSAATNPSPTPAPTSTSVAAQRKVDEKSASGVRLQVGNDYLNRLYSNQNNLDVRWQNKEENLELTNEEDPKDEKRKRLELMTKVNDKRCSALPLYGRDFQDAVKIFVPNNKNTWAGGGVNCLNALFGKDPENIAKVLTDMLYNPERRLEQLKDICDRFIFYVPAVKSPEPDLQVWHPPPSTYWGQQEDQRLIQRLFSKPATPLHHIASAMVTQFPDPRLIQYDCGKLQTLDRLLRNLKTDGHRVLIFTQMSKMLDVLEAFLNFHGYIYLRLDGTTKVDQRQLLMERFNGDSRIFAFILSTRSGGVGVNLTGADTVIFYDSDWNPTMDAQAQDRCHRIGQTKDVHIYRLVSEKTIEENILKKANQKRLLGDLAIEGGNFTTAYFKSTTIQDLFNIDTSEDSAANRISGTSTLKKEVDKSGETSLATNDEKSAVFALENALAECEDAQDVQAAKIAKAEAVADLAEFDENIPLEEQDKEKEPEMSKAELEINNIIQKLSPIEKYAMKFIETTESAWSAEQLAAAEREIENQKREWEQNRLAAMKEEEERRNREIEEESELLTFSREDAANQIWVSDNTMEKMPMWCPPTPPQQDSDVYIDQTLSFLYDTQTVMSETDLPPVYTKREAKRSRIEVELIDSRRAMKLSRKEDSNTAPKSLFHSAQILKMRRDLKLQKYRSFVRPSISIPGKANVQKPQVEQSPLHEWTIHEDIALLKVIQSYLGLPLNFAAMKPGHTPNWDFVSDYVNTVSITYRSPKQCRQRYESHLFQREEDKRLGIDSTFKKKNKVGKVQKLTLPSKTRSLRNSQLYLQDNNSAFSQIMSDRFDTLKNMSMKRVVQTRSIPNNPLINKNRNTPVLNECGIDLEHPVLPVEVAARRAERIAKEKRTLTPEQQIAAAKLQLMKGYIPNQQHSTAVASTSAPNTSIATIGVTTTQVVLTASTPSVSTVTSISVPGTPNALRAQRVTASPVQTSAVVSVSGLSPAQLQAATQRLIVSAGASGQAKAVAASTSGMQGKSISPAQLAMIRQASIKQQLRLHANNLAAQGVKTSTVTIGGQQAVVQFTQAQPRAQFVRQVTVSGKTGLTRTVTESEVAQLLKKQHQLQQQQKLATAAATGTIQNISSQVLAQAIQASSSGSPVATLVKTVSASDANQTVTIPVTGVTLTTQGKMITSTMKPTNATQLRQLQLQQQQILAQKKLAGQKLSFAQVGGKSNMQTQLIVGSKQVPTAMTVQQFQQVIRSPLNVSNTPVVLAKVPPRVIPVNTSQGTKQTVQVVAATSQSLSSALSVPRVNTALAGTLTGFKNQTLITAALNQNVAMRQSSPVRIQANTATPLVAVTVQNVQQQQQQPQQQGGSSQPPNIE